MSNFRSDDSVPDTESLTLQDYLSCKRSQFPDLLWDEEVKSDSGDSFYDREDIRVEFQDFYTDKYKSEVSRKWDLELEEGQVVDSDCSGEEEEEDFYESRKRVLAEEKRRKELEELEAEIEEKKKKEELKPTCKNSRFFRKRFYSSLYKKYFEATDIDLEFEGDLGKYIGVMKSVSPEFRWEESDSFYSIHSQDFDVMILLSDRKRIVKKWTSDFDKIFDHRHKISENLRIEEENKRRENEERIERERKIKERKERMKMDIDIEDESKDYSKDMLNFINIDEVKRESLYKLENKLVKLKWGKYSEVLVYLVEKNGLMRDFDRVMRGDVIWVNKSLPNKKSKKFLVDYRYLADLTGNRCNTKVCRKINVSNDIIDLVRKVEGGFVPLLCRNGDMYLDKKEFLEEVGEKVGENPNPKDVKSIESKTESLIRRCIKSSILERNIVSIEEIGFDGGSYNKLIKPCKTAILREEGIRKPKAEDFDKISWSQICSKGKLNSFYKEVKGIKVNKNIPTVKVTKGDIEKFKSDCVKDFAVSVNEELERSKRILSSSEDINSGLENTLCWKKVKSRGVLNRFKKALIDYPHLRDVEIPDFEISNSFKALENLDEKYNRGIKILSSQSSAMGLKRDINEIVDSRVNYGIKSDFMNKLKRNKKQIKTGLEAKLINTGTTKRIEEKNNKDGKHNVSKKKKENKKWNKNLRITPNEITDHRDVISLFNGLINKLWSKRQSIVKSGIRTSKYLLVSDKNFFIKQIDREYYNDVIGKSKTEKSRMEIRGFKKVFSGDNDFLKKMEDTVKTLEMIGEDVKILGRFRR